MRLNTGDFIKSTVHVEKLYLGIQKSQTLIASKICLEQDQILFPTQILKYFAECVRYTI
jgi:hypothetical protein